MRRLGIFVFYDPSGIVDGYVEALLSGLTQIIDRFVIVVNGRILEESKAKLEEFSEDIFYRKNIGYDGGAYKDALLTYLKDESWENWDEIVLFNDTFYAPICPWQPVFNKMEAEDVDFWGLTEHPGGELLPSGELCPPHIQGYFLVCKKNLVMSECFWEFWNHLDYPKSYGEAIVAFEIGFAAFFQEKGFFGKSYMACCDEMRKFQGDSSLKVNNPYIIHAYELIHNFHFPVLKKKALTIFNYSQMIKVLQHVDNHSDYELDLIAENTYRLMKENRIRTFNIPILFRFQKRFDEWFLRRHAGKKKSLIKYYKSVRTYMFPLMLLGRMRNK